MTMTEPGRLISAPDRPTSFCLTCRPAVVIEMGRPEIAHTVECPWGLLDYPQGLTTAQGGSQRREGAA